MGPRPRRPGWQSRVRATTRPRPTLLPALLLVLLLLLLQTCAAVKLVLDAGPNVGSIIPLRLRHYLSPWLLAPDESNDISLDNLLGVATGQGPQKRGKDEEDVLVVSVGDSASFHALLAHVPEWKAAWDDRAGMHESFGVFTLHRGGVTVLAGNGVPIDPVWNASTTVHTGAAYAAYDIMQSLGFAFWSPLEGGIAPATLHHVPAKDGTKTVQWEAPRWRGRTFHLHTQHPLELTDVLQGFDLPFSLDRGGVGAEGRAQDADAWASLARLEARLTATGLVAAEGTEACANTNQDQEAEGACAAVRARGEHCELWEDMVPDVMLFYEWSVAHRLNRIEWILLGNRRWGALVDSPLRQARLRLLATLGQGLGLMIGVDDPIAFQQQHSWVMTTTLAPEATQLAAVRDRVDWLLGGVGLDFVSTESGYSEFTAPNDHLMLDLLNTFAERANGTWGKEATVKVHCSSHQFCKHFTDPRTGSPLNFNFLPSYATEKLGVLPHTVQAYALDDPTAGVYGTANFTFMAEYIRWEAGQGGAGGSKETRAVHFYPETAYWVQVDANVPLFLPLYAERRLHDLLLLAEYEDEDGFRLAGNWNFDSGWEWGYWLNDVVMAAVMWDPRQFGGFRQALDKALRPLPAAARASVAAWVSDLVEFQYRTMLLGGLADGAPCPNQSKLSGIAYLCGKDTWVELPRKLGIDFTQPNYVAMHEHDDPDYPYVQPLLAHMQRRTAALHAEGNVVVESLAAGTDVHPALLEHVRELRDGAAMLALRAQQVALLYEATSPPLAGPDHAEERQRLLAEGRVVLEAATAVVRTREQHYHAPLERIAGWRENPTVYHWDYLWSVKTLFFWWRDQGRAEGSSWQARWSFCYLNFQDPSEVALGIGKNVLRAIRNYAPYVLPFAGTWSECLGPPATEYAFPRDL